MASDGVLWCCLWRRCSDVMFCGLWFVVCGLWFVVCGLWFVVCDEGRAPSTQAPPSTPLNEQTPSAGREGIPPDSSQPLQPVQPTPDQTGSSGVSTDTR